MNTPILGPWKVMPMDNDAGDLAVVLVIADRPCGYVAKVPGYAVNEGTPYADVMAAAWDMLKILEVIDDETLLDVREPCAVGLKDDIRTLLARVGCRTAGYYGMGYGMRVGSGGQGE